MTKKDYVILAEAIKEFRLSGLTAGATLDLCAIKLCELLAPKLKKDNPAFNYERFVKAIK